MPPDYPGAIWYPSPNFGYPRGKAGRNGHKVVAIVDHITGGSAAAALSWLTNPDAHVSAHYHIRRDGRIEQLVRDEDASWGAGLDFKLGYDAYKSNRSIPWIDECWAKRINPNLIVINVEHEASAGQGLTDAQYQSSLGLHRDLCRRHDIPTSGEFIVGHYQIDAVNRGNDPGPGFPWARLLGDLNAVEAPPLDLRQLREDVSALEALGKALIGHGQEVVDRAKAIWTNYRLGDL